MKDVTKQTKLLQSWRVLQTSISEFFGVEKNPIVAVMLGQRSVTAMSIVK